MICLRQKLLNLRNLMKSDSNQDVALEKQEQSQVNKSLPV